MWPAPPYWKSKGFCPNPIVKYGIPKYADSVRNKKVIGTPDWQKFWEQELYYIRNGYRTGGIDLPGRFYYFMNYRKLPTIRGPIYPDMVDLHLELAHLIDYAKSARKHIICAKGRRKGISEFTHASVIDYGYRFTYDYKAGIAAGLDDYVQDFMAKWRYADSLIVPEFRTIKLLNNNDEVISGYEEKVDGDFQESGTRNTIYARTMFTNPNLFKGLYLNDIVAEEAGEFPKLKGFYSASKDCTMFGSIQYGTMFVYGTGGKMNKESKDFKEMWDKAEHYNFIKFFIPGTRFYFPFYGGALEAGKIVSETPNIIKKPFESTGVEDLTAAEGFIKTELEKLSKGNDPKKYNEYKQNNPLKPEDVFRNTVVNDFDSEKLNAQKNRISALPTPKYAKYRMNWVKDNDGIIIQPRRVTLEPLKDFEDEVECIYILTEIIPFIGKYVNLFCSGLDSYDQDTSKTSKSLGAMCIIIREHNFPIPYRKCPVAIIRTRPKRKEKFYELTLKASVLFDLVGNVLIDVRCPAVIQYFKDTGGEKFLAKRPAKFERENSEQGHDYGVSMNNYSKPLMTGLMQSNIYDYSEYNWFDSELEQGPNLITELQNYDEVAIGSDNDSADAYGYALMQDISAEVRPKDKLSISKDDAFDIPEFELVGGEVLMKQNYIVHLPMQSVGRRLDEWGDPIDNSEKPIKWGSFSSDD